VGLFFFISEGSMATKPFLTIDEQLDKLKTRGLIIKNEVLAKKVLSRENYYNVINGYKKPFLKKDLTGNICTPECYIDDCEFCEIYALHNLDRDIRILLLGFLLKFETHFKTSCAYHFSEAHLEQYSYLNISNYSNDKSALSNVLKNFAALSTEINKNTNEKQKKSLYVSHYIENHDSVPLWVLVNTLTIGNMSYFYNALDAKLQSKIAKDFSEQYKNEYNSKEKIDIEEIKQIVKMVNLFRNVCAHEEVLYLFSLDKKIKYKIFGKYFIDHRIDDSIIERSDLFTLVLLLKLILMREDYVEFIEGIDRIFEKYRNQFRSVNFNDIILLSGFIDNWKEIIYSLIKHL
jgi:abortive infection bacteriophage resistance protein